MELYRWQEACLGAWEENRFHGIVNVITGAGKTVTAMAGIRRLLAHLSLTPRDEGLRVRVVVPTTALALQWQKQLRDFFPEVDPHQIGVFFGGQKDRSTCFCLVYVVNSARYSLSRHVINDMKEDVHTLLICDECHHYTGPENSKIFSFIGAPGYRGDLYASIGLSATPQCSGYERVLVPALGHEIYQYSLMPAAEEERISRFSVHQIQIPFTAPEMAEYVRLTTILSMTYPKLIQLYPELAELSPFKLIVRLQELAAEEGEDSLPANYLRTLFARRHICVMAENRIQCTLDLVERLPGEERILIFCEKIVQAERIYSVIRSRYPTLSGLYHSKTHPLARRRILSDFGRGAIRILVCCKALDEGVDVPDATVGIVVSSAMTSRQRIQRLGRILRRAANKQRSMLYYLHLDQGVDEPAYLPALEVPSPVVSLSYLPQEHAFDCPEYFALASKVFSNAVRTHPPEDYLRELRFCIELGAPLSDWLMPIPYLDDRISKAKTRRETNYYKCMRSISRVRESGPRYSYFENPALYKESPDAYAELPAEWEEESDEFFPENH